MNKESFSSLWPAIDFALRFYYLKQPSKGILNLIESRYYRGFQFQEFKKGKLLGSKTPTLEDIESALKIAEKNGWIYSVIHCKEHGPMWTFTQKFDPEWYSIIQNMLQDRYKDKPKRKKPKKATK